MNTKSRSCLTRCWALSMLLLLCTGGVYADVVLVDDVEYELYTSNKTAKVLSVSQDAKSITIPAIVTYEDEDYEVVELGYDVTFAGNTNLTSVTIEMPLTEIPGSFFMKCAKLSSIRLPEGVSFIGRGAFSYCESITSLGFLPKSVNRIGYEAFCGCTGLTEIVIQKGVDYYSNVFDGCSGVASVTIEAVESNVFIGYGGFTSLKTVRIEDCDAPLSVNLPNDAPIEELYIGRNVELGFNKTNLKAVTFGEKVTYVPEGMFDGASALSSVTWGNKIKWIGKRAFYGTALVDLNLPECVDSLAEETFAENQMLETIKLPSTLKHIGSSCFFDSQVREIVFPESLEAIDGFNGCDSLKRIIISDNAKVIKHGAFRNCKKLDEIVIGKNVVSIEFGAFAECEKVYHLYYNGSLSDWCRIDISGQEDTYGTRNFYVKSDDGTYQVIKDLVIPEDVEVIKSNAFGGFRAFNSVTIPATVRLVDEGAFWGCNMNSIYINADTIASLAFQACNSLKNVTLGTNVKMLKNYAIYWTITSYATTYEGSMGEWLKLKKELNALKCGALTIGGVLLTEFAPEQYSISEIPANAFYNCTSLKTVVLPYSVKTIGSHAFEDCKNLTEVEAKGVTAIANSAFAGCDNLVKADFVYDNATRAGVTESISIGASAFSGCSKLEEIFLPESITEVGRAAFDNTLWYNIQPDGIVYLKDFVYAYKGQMPEDATLSIRNGATIICDNAFQSQNNLKEILIPNSVKEIGDYAFNGCSNLAFITVPESVTTIGESAFNSCGLRQFNLLSPIDTIPANMLNGCRKLESISIPKSVNYVSRGAFSGCSSVENINIEDSDIPLTFEGYYLTYYGEPYYMYCPEVSPRLPSLAKHIYLGREIQMPEFLYDYGYGYGEEDLNKKINIFAADSLKTLTIGENVTILELPQIPLYEEWQSGGYTTPLTKITCLATVPPTFSVDGNGDVRDPFIHKYVDSWAVDFIKAVVPLSVPQEAVEAYKNADVWKGFYTIQGEDFSGIDVEQVGMPNNACYDLMGRKITDTENLKGGIYIINGRKVMVK